MRGRQRAMDQNTQVQLIRTGPASVGKGHVPKVLRRPSMEWRSKGGKRKGDPCGNPLFLVNECLLELVSLSRGSRTPTDIKTGIPRWREVDWSKSSGVYGRLVPGEERSSVGSACSSPPSPPPAPAPPPSLAGACSPEGQADTQRRLCHDLR